jgi:hypothetical protein
MPSDLYKPVTVESTRSKFGLENDFAKNVYNNYDKISNRVNRILETSFSIVYDLYHKWLEIKSKYPRDYDQIVEKMEFVGADIFKDSLDRVALTASVKAKMNDCDQKPLTFNDFITFLLKNSSIDDIGRFFKDDTQYLETISILRAELLKENSYDLDAIDFDIGATHNEFPIVKGSGFHESLLPSFAFKVVPTLRRIQSFTSNLTSEFDNTIPLFKYKVVIDINRLIYTIISIYDPSNLSEALAKGETDKTTYITNGLLRFKNCPEIFTRKIILELFDNYHNVYGNWKAFVTKFKECSDKFFRSPDIVNVTTKLSHFSMSIPSNMSEEFTEYFYYFNELGERSISNSDDLYELLFFASRSNKPSDLFNALFTKTFIQFFSTGVCYNVYHKQNGTIDELVIYQYYKEFFAKYDTNQLLQSTSSIEDYVTRDFYQTIIRENQIANIKPYSSKLQNNENAYFMACKMRRNIWIDLTTVTMISFKLIKTIKECSLENDSQKVFIRSLSKLYHTFEQALTNLLMCDNYDKSLWTDRYSYFAPYLMNESLLPKKIRYIKTIFGLLTYRTNGININGNNLIDDCKLPAVSEYDATVLDSKLVRENSYKLINWFKETGFIPLIDDIPSKPEDES